MNQVSTSFMQQVRFAFRIAWRDSRRNRSRLLLFTSSIILGIAALVAINSFGVNLREEVDEEAQALLGADLVLTTNQVPSDSARELIDSLKLSGEYSRENNFASMVYFPKTQGTRLIQVRALEGDFPFYGQILTEPAQAGRSFQQGRYALADQTLMMQFGVTVGDSLKVGKVTFEIAGKLIQAPGQNGITASVAPVVYIPMAFVDSTELIQKGSRVNYNHYYRYDAAVDVEAMVKTLEPKFRMTRLRSDTVEERKEDLGRAFSDMTDFLSLVGFVALLLGCVGVASAVHIYIREKRGTVAILRCLGVKSNQAFAIYLIQITAMGLAGSVIGAFLGSVIQTFLPQVLGEFLPLAVEFEISWPSIGQGILTGLGISILFALLPLLAVRQVSPLYTLRASAESVSTGRDYLRWAVFGLIALFVWGFAWVQTGGAMQATYFTLGLGLAFLLLTGVARLIMWLVRKYFPTGWSYLWRQSLANLYRPNNQTLILIVSIGLGTALITTLFFVQDLLISKVAFSAQGDLPNMVLFDIQTNQKEELAQLTRDQGLPVMQEVPIVTMRISNIHGKSRSEWLKDTTRHFPRWVLNREYRVTFRDSLINTEEIAEGKWIGKIDSQDDSVFVSIEEGFGKENMKLKLGDPITFNVQGIPVDAFVGSFRKVDFARVQTNFLVLFPSGVLENAPQFHVLMTKTPDEVVSAKYQREVVIQYPNVSLVDLSLILKTVDDILGKVSFVIRFMALFSIFTGILVLIGSIIISKYQRIQESVLLRTLGASRRQILQINALEYFFLGSLASLTGIFIALIGSWALAYFSFETSFLPSLWPILGVFVAITGMTILIGMLNSRSVLNKPPLEILRGE